MIAPTNNTTLRPSGKRLTSFFTERVKLRAGIFRNLIAICFLISVALASSGEKCPICCGDAHEEKNFTLTTQKSGWRTKAAGFVLSSVGVWKDTSTIEVRYHPTRTHVNTFGGNNHKFEKVNGWWKANEWFTITKMLEHDKINNRINVQIHGMTNRWIYYLENDASKFIELLQNEEKTVNLGHKMRKIDAIKDGRVEGLPCQCPLGKAYAEDWAKETKPVPEGQVCQLGCFGTGRAFPTREELKRGDAANGVYGFRVALQKEGSIGQWMTGKSTSVSILRDHFDAVSVRVYLKECKACAGTGNAKKERGDRKENWHVLRTWLTLGMPEPRNDGDRCQSCGGKGFSNKVDYITIPNNIREKQAHITKIDCFQSDAQTVILRLKDVADSKMINITGSTAADRRLFLGCYAGKRLLKFLVDHAGDYADDITDESKFTDCVAEIDADWDTRPMLAQNNATVVDRRRLADRLASSHEAAYESIRW